ncbi:hypothetical protein [Ochrovirga pacifica]|uniref:hypothetical protein n=1 Tax=Ochrovirga pacifica TaxID=1042376 RepID=UPI0002558015|nr:hypothetical protein [Ochrovirga pacifica]
MKHTTTSDKKAQQTKRIILSLLFIGPLAFFIFLSTGEVNFKPCEVFSENVVEVGQYTQNKVVFKDRINIVNFLGKHPNSKATQIFNLNEVVFEAIAKYQKFQMVSFYVGKDNPEIETIKSRLKNKGVTKLYKWKFVCLDSIQTKEIYQSLKIKTPLDHNFASDDAFIVDKKIQQRGRTDDDKIGDDVFAYFMGSVDDLKNKLLPDTKNVFYEQEVATTSRKERLKKDEE